MDDPNHPDAFAVRLQPTQCTTYWDRCNSLHAGDINECHVIQRVWKEALDEYDEFAEIVEMLMETGAEENDPALLELNRCSVTRGFHDVRTCGRRRQVVTGATSSSMIGRRGRRLHCCAGGGSNL
eukprot:scaffold64140_cov31-Attheya_sp.AAC.1